MAVAEFSKLPLLTRMVQPEHPNRLLRACTRGRVDVGLHTHLTSSREKEESFGVIRIGLDQIVGTIGRTVRSVFEVTTVRLAVARKK